MRVRVEYEQLVPASDLPQDPTMQLTSTEVRRQLFTQNILHDFLTNY